MYSRERKGCANNRSGRRGSVPRWEVHSAEWRAEITDPHGAPSFAGNSMTFSESWAQVTIDA